MATTASLPSDWPTDAKLYQLIGKIGQGAFATVWKAQKQTEEQQEQQQQTPQYCAVKVLNLDHVDTNLSEIRLEVQSMRLLAHENVLTCYTAFVNDRHLWLVTPLMRKGSSLHCLQTARRALRHNSQQQQHISPNCYPTMEPHILYILHETLLGLQYIHDNGQIHRDIKAGNILLDDNGDVRIADFGVSGWLVGSDAQLRGKAKTFVGTPCWMAPEVMEQVHGYDYKADIWSLGITALELARGYAPYAKYPPMKVLILTIQEDPPSLDSYDVEDEDDYDTDESILYASQEQYSRNVFSPLVATCLQKNPSRRPNCQELLSSKYLAQYSADPSFRQAQKEAIRNQVCALVQDVGTKQQLQQQQQAGGMPGNTPISIIMSQVEDDRPAGTTWVFADGSQVLSSSMQGDEVDDVLAELDEFEKQTGGEHYDPRNAPPPQQQQQQQQATSGGAEDDLDQFMDEFELNTGGEDFRRQEQS